MERRLYLFLFSIAATALGLGGCDNDAASIKREPAGEACAAGGVRIGEGDEAFYICDSPISEEAPGENCPTGGFRVQDGEGVRYLCNPPLDPSPEEEKGELRIEELPIDEALAHCGSAAIRIIQSGAEEEEQIVCVKAELEYDPIVRVVKARGESRALYDASYSCVWEDDYEKSDFFLAKVSAQTAYAYALIHANCASELLNLLGPPPEGSAIAYDFECEARKSEGLRDCYINAIAAHEKGICGAGTFEFDSSVGSCLNRTRPGHGFCNGPKDPTYEAMQWDYYAREIADTLACDLSLVYVF